ncbi:hypothetical protein [Phaeodactylibacter xiamenensis]|uniref:hypothetical protein n=1 Tax=Phaeodactylibacter xiamenensis TaxID=1524460 RepID=UPI0024A84C16|nr:hypothetical protein [Phaeodactylibacter xiamenensis]
MPALKIAHNVHAEAGKTTYRVDLPKSYRTMEAKFERYNDSQERTCDKTKMPHIFLAKELIRLYARKFSVWQITGDRILNKAQDMPLLSINNKFLGEITGRTDRSIRNYRKVLQRAGFFLPVGYDEQDMPVYEVHHGRQADFEVAINPDFLWMEVAKTKEKFRIPTTPLKALTRKNFPPTSTSTVQEQQEQQELVGGKNCVFAEKSAQEQPEQQEPSSGEPVGSSAGRQEPGDKNEPRRFGPDDQKTGTGIPAGGGDFDPDRAQKVRNQSKTLLNGARTYLYPGEAWSKEYRRTILITLDRLYGDASPELFAKITAVYWQRMKLAQLYWHKQYGELPEPHVFFDPDNPDGFRLTKGWINEPEKYPPPARQTYRKPGQRRANGRRGQGVVTLGDLI